MLRLGLRKLAARRFQQEAVPMAAAGQLVESRLVPGHPNNLQYQQLYRSSFSAIVTSLACSQLVRLESGCRGVRLAWRQCGSLAPRRRWLAAAAEAPAAAARQQTIAQQQQEQPLITEPEHPPSPLERLMQHARLTHLAQELWGQVVRRGDTVVDATCGNGHDTAYLAQAVGSGGTVHAFDVQPAAIEAARAAVGAAVPADQAPEVHFHLASHAEMRERLGCTACASLVVFNLGYLPGSDKATTTQAGSTLAAVQAACDVLKPGGLLSILCYTGHPGGVEEYEAVRALLGQLPPSGWVSSETRLLNRPAAPILLLAWKRG
ncbi:hypothetical protein ABPG75_011194 [Micractinium tetrahymenae]